VKLDPDGNLEWGKTFGGPDLDGAHSVQQTSDGGYIVAGYTASYGAGGAFWGDFWLVKLDPNGNLEWEKGFGGADEDAAISVQQTADGGYVVAGYTYSYGAGQSDFWLVKVDPDGNLEWEKTFGGALWDGAWSVQQTIDGGYIVAGYTYSYGAGSSDFWLVKVDPDGNLQWDKTFGGADSDEAYSVQQTTDGGYIVAGYTYSYGAGSSDFWLVKVHPDGNLQWDKTFGGADSDGALSVQQTSDGGYIVAGETCSYGAGSADFYIIKLESEQIIDTTPPSSITDFNASDGEDGQSTLTWTNPPDADLAEVVVRRKTDGYPADHTDGDLIYQDTSPASGHAVSYTDTGLANGTTYYYAVFSRDAAGNWNDTVQPGKNADTATPEITRSITVISPNGGGEWPVGSTQEIKWESQNAGAYVKIEYSTDGGSTWKTIVNSTDNDGSYSWVVPNDPSDSCRVKVTSLAYPSVYDLSDSNFAIVVGIVRFVPVCPRSDSVASEVISGGIFYRYYRLVDELDRPVANANVFLNWIGNNEVMTSDEQGLVRLKGYADKLGLGTHSAVGLVERVVLPEGGQASIAEEPHFDVTVTPASTSDKYTTGAGVNVEAGPSIGVGVGPFAVDIVSAAVTLGGGASLGIVKEGDVIRLTRDFTAEVGGKFHLGPEVEIGAVSVEAGIGAEATYRGLGGQDLVVSLPLDFQEKRALAAFVWEPLIASGSLYFPGIEQLISAVIASWSGMELHPYFSSCWSGGGHQGRIHAGCEVKVITSKENGSGDSTKSTSITLGDFSAELLNFGLCERHYSFYGEPAREETEVSATLGLNLPEVRELCTQFFPGLSLSTNQKVEFYIRNKVADSGNLQSVKLGLTVVPSWEGILLGGSTYAGYESVLTLEGASLIPKFDT